MLENVVQDRDFALLMKKNMQDMIVYFFEKEQNFGILCKIDDVSFEPALPASINDEFRPMTLFFLAGYTFETAQIIDDTLVFEAGFGNDNFGSVVSVPLLSVMQIIIEESTVLINLSSYEEKSIVTEEIDSKGVKNSMSSFLSNPENSKFLKK